MEGPPCPRCGCRDVQPWGRGREGASLGDKGIKHVHTPHVCQHCGHRFTVTTRKGKHRVDGEYLRSVCPFCGSANWRIYKTRRLGDGTVRRYHKCRSCGETFITDQT